MTMASKWFTPMLLLAAMVLTAGVYWVGLQGPFLFDDGPNFSIIKRWLEGKAGLQQVLFGNTSWLTNRSLAMGSFAINAWLFGYVPFGFKLGNLILHLICGAIAYKFLVVVLRRDPALTARAQLAALLIVAAWLLHPFNASTVLYAVQRMTQIAALSCLLGVWLYVSVRVRQEEGRSRHGWVALFIGIPLLTLLGIQGKQNAAVLPALCLVLELAYFRMPRIWERPLKLFYALLLGLPGLVVVLALALRPDLLLSGYNEYSFSMGERLLSEARVLCDYLRMLLVPHPPAMGVYTDDFLPSSGWFSPPTTALSILFLALATAGAWRVRARHPSIFAGWFLFLAAHAVEGTILPIELYYEHRNYLPAIGIFLACAGIIAALGRWLAKIGIRGGRIGVAAGAALLLMLSVQTHGRARVWSDLYVLAESALSGHPDSTRAVLNYVGLALESGDPDRAYAVIEQTIAQSNDAKLRGLARLFRIRMDCQLKGRASAADLPEVVSLLPPHVDLTMVQIMGYTRHLIERKEGCTGISKTQFADAIALTVDKASLQPDSAWAKWMLRYRAAGLYAADNEWDKALVQARLAWQPTTEPAASDLLIDALLHHGMVPEAERIYREAVARSNVSNPEEREGLKKLQQKIDTAARPSGKGKT